MVDRTTKTLLLAIAVGLWLNVMNQWTRPEPVHAQSLAGVELAIGAMNIDMNNWLKGIGANLELIQKGTCANRVLCD